MKLCCADSSLCEKQVLQQVHKENARRAVNRQSTKHIQTAKIWLNGSMAEKGILDPRSEQGIFVGYDKYSPAYVVYYPGTERVQKHRLMKFTTKTANESARSLVESLRL